MLVMDWFCDILQLPLFFRSESRTGGGVIQGSASEAILVCMIAGELVVPSTIDTCSARERVLSQLDDETREQNASRLVFYGSDQTHSVLAKGCRILGIPNDRLIADPRLKLTSVNQNPAGFNEEIRFKPASSESSG